MATNKLNNKQKAFVDELFKNGFNQTEAYITVYQSVTNRNYAKTAASRMMTNANVKGYYDNKYAEYRKGLDINKEKMIDMLKDELNLFDEMKRLANKESLTPTEEGRLYRLSMLLKGSDAAKTRDMINKLIGAYAPDKSEVTHKGINIQIVNPNPKDDKSK